MATTPRHGLPYPGPSDQLRTIRQYSENFAATLAPKIPLAWATGTTIANMTGGQYVLDHNLGVTPDHIAIHDNRSAGAGAGIVWKVIIRGSNQAIVEARRSNTGELMPSLGTNAAIWHAVKL